MVYVGKGIVRQLRSGTSQKGNSYNLLELGGEDFARHTVFVPLDMVSQVQAIPVNTWVMVKVSCEDTSSGSRTTLSEIQLSK